MDQDIGRRNNGASSFAESCSLPLSGIRVIELSHLVMGPACGMILGDLGADVIKIEPPTGDSTRRLPGAGAGLFQTFNRNKRSVTLDLEREDARTALFELIEQADVFVENFRPGYMKRYGLDYSSLRARNPRLIYVSLKGFLPGPYQRRLALDEAVQMMAGLAYMTGPRGQPLRVGSSVNDIMGGMFGVVGVLAALRDRERYGVGQQVQSGLFENCALLGAQHMQQFAATGEPPAPMPERVHAWGVYDIFELANGEQMFIAATSNTQWRTLCEIVGRADLRDDRRLVTNCDRVRARAWLLPDLRATLCEVDRVTLAGRLETGQIPFGEIRMPEELFADPHLRESGSLAPLILDDGIRTEIPVLPLMLGDARFGPRRPIAKVGEHTVQVLRELGYDDAHIAELMRREN
ncbi:CaiB/BaiF CoA transferase family protein [Burkholderia ubonensis]|uniref:CaiB/BaiF CoA transferase family protein n=1 Tax=Burkholderia ubonensis TaxID=101571 RepID=UPI0007586E4E|nr:CaiB/BaiF CoA-transferase family protein [Burkholderia ubonensis]KWB80669.1 CoA-transferase [Burkholderia ubonensis]